MTRLRTGFLSDQSVLDRCPEENSIPCNKMNLAARSGAKISCPQKAGFMYPNLPIPHAQKESLINEFVLRSQKQLPLKIPAMEYSTVSLDKVGALVTQTQNGGDVSNDVLQSLMNSLNQSQISANESLSDESLSETSDDQTGSPPNSRPPSPGNREILNLQREGRNLLLNRQNQQEPASTSSTRGSISANNDPNLSNDPIVFSSPTPHGGRVNAHTRFATPQKDYYMV